MDGSVAEWLACWTQAQKSSCSNRSRDAVGKLFTHIVPLFTKQRNCMVAALLRVARVTVGLAEKMAAYRRVYDSRHLQPLTAKVLRTGISISSGTLRSVIEYGLFL